MSNVALFQTRPPHAYTVHCPHCPAFVVGPSEDAAFTHLNAHILRAHLLPTADRLTLDNDSLVAQGVH